MFLSGNILSDLGQNLIRPFNPSQVDCAAYTLRMGDEAYVSPEGRRNRKPALIQLNYEQPIDIPSGQFAFLLTREIVTVPYDMIAFINMKNGLKSSGLINVSGFHVDPGYQGKLVFSVFNAGPRTITVRQNDDAFLIWFARLEMATPKFARNKQGFSKIDSTLIARIPEESASFNSLNMRIEAVEKSLSWRKNLTVFVISFVSATIAGLIASYYAAKALLLFGG